MKHSSRLALVVIAVLLRPSGAFPQNIVVAPLCAKETGSLFVGGALALGEVEYQSALNAKEKFIVQYKQGQSFGDDCDGGTIKVRQGYKVGVFSHKGKELVPFRYGTLDATGDTVPDGRLLALGAGARKWEILSLKGKPVTERLFDSFYFPKRTWKKGFLIAGVSEPGTATEAVRPFGATGTAWVRSWRATAKASGWASAVPALGEVFTSELRLPRQGESVALVDHDGRDLSSARYRAAYATEAGAVYLVAFDGRLLRLRTGTWEADDLSAAFGRVEAMGVDLFLLRGPDGKLGLARPESLGDAPQIPFQFDEADKLLGEKRRLADGAEVEDYLISLREGSRWRIARVPSDGSPLLMLEGSWSEIEKDGPRLVLWEDERKTRSRVFGAYRPGTAPPGSTAVLGPSGYYLLPEGVEHAAERVSVSGFISTAVDVPAGWTCSSDRAVHQYNRLPTGYAGYALSDAGGKPQLSFYSQWVVLALRPWKNGWFRAWTQGSGGPVPIAPELIGTEFLIGNRLLLIRDDGHLLPYQDPAVRTPRYGQPYHAVKELPTGELVFQYGDEKGFMAFALADVKGNLLVPADAWTSLFPGQPSRGWPNVASKPGSTILTDGKGRLLATVSGAEFAGPFEAGLARLSRVKGGRRVWSWMKADGKPLPVADYEFATDMTAQGRAVAAREGRAFFVSQDGVESPCPEYKSLRAADRDGRRAVAVLPDGKKVILASDGRREPGSPVYVELEPLGKDGIWLGRFMDAGRERWHAVQAFDETSGGARPLTPPLPRAPVRAQGGLGLAEDEVGGLWGFSETAWPLSVDYRGAPVWAGILALAEANGLGSPAMREVLRAETLADFSSAASLIDKAVRAEPHNRFHRVRKARLLEDEALGLERALGLHRKVQDLLKEARDVLELARRQLPERQDVTNTFLDEQIKLFDSLLFARADKLAKLEKNAEAEAQKQESIAAARAAQGSGVRPASGPTGVSAEQRAWDAKMSEQRNRFFEQRREEYSWGVRK